MCVCRGAVQDPPLKRAGSSRLRDGRYHPPPRGARTPRGAGEVEVAGAGSRRVLGCSDCSIPSGWVCVFPALSAGNGAARGGLRGLRDAAEPGVLGEPGGSPVEMLLVSL